MAGAAIHESDAAGQRARLNDRRRRIARGKDENYIWSCRPPSYPLPWPEVEGWSLVYRQGEVLCGVGADAVGRSDGDRVWPPVPAAGVPERVAVPLPLSMNSLRRAAYRIRQAMLWTSCGDDGERAC